MIDNIVAFRPRRNPKMVELLSLRDAIKQDQSDLNTWRRFFEVIASIDSPAEDQIRDWKLYTRCVKSDDVIHDMDPVVASTHVFNHVSNLFNAEINEIFDEFLDVFDRITQHRPGFVETMDEDGKKTLHLDTSNAHGRAMLSAVKRVREKHREWDETSDDR